MSIGGDSGRDLKTLGQKIERARNELELTQDGLAKSAHTTSKAVRKITSGEKVSERILLHICAVVGVDADDGRAGNYADDDHGGYSLSSLKDYVGQYRAYRRSLNFPTYILRAGFRIYWDPRSKFLRFDELQKYKSAQNGEMVDRSQSGEVFIGGDSGLFHLVTKARGAIRIITLSRFRRRNPKDLTMRGIVLTQAPRETGHVPSAAAILFERIDPPEKDLENYAKEMSPSTDGEYKKIAAELTDAERHVVNFALTP